MNVMHQKNSYHLTLTGTSREINGVINALKELSRNTMVRNSLRQSLTLDQNIVFDDFLKKVSNLEI